MPKRTSSRKDSEFERKSISFPAFTDRSRVIMLENPERYLVISVDDTVQIYSLPHFIFLRSLKLRGLKTSVCSLDVYDDVLVVASTDDCVRIWDLVSGECLRTLNGEGKGCLFVNADIDLDRSGEFRKDFFLKDPWVLTWHKHSKLPNFSIRRLAAINKTNDSGESLSDFRSIDTHDHEIRSLASRGRIAVTGGFDCTVRVWNIFTGDCQWVFIGHSGTVTQVDIHQNSCYSLSRDGSLRTWDLRNGECHYILGSKIQRVREVGISTSYLTYTCSDNSIYVRDLATVEMKYQLNDALINVDSGWQHDDHKIMVESEEGMTFWDIRTGKLFKFLGPPLQSEILLPFLGTTFCVAIVERDEEVWLDIWKFADDDADARGEGTRMLVKPKRRRWIEVTR